MGIDPVTAAIGGSVITGVLGSRSAKKAADAQASASDAAIAEQRRQFDTLLGLNRPFITAGQNSVNELSRLFGYPQGVAGAASPTQAPQSPFMQTIGNGLLERYGVNLPSDVPRETMAQNELPMGLDVFQASPDFEFRRSQGLQGIAQTLGAGGQGAFSGNALRGLNEFNSNLASGEFDNFVQRRLALAGLGGANTQQTGSAAMNTGANIGNLLTNQGNARASGIMGQGLAVNQGMNGILNALLLRNMGLLGGGSTSSAPSVMGGWGGFR